MLALPEVFSSEDELVLQLRRAIESNVKLVVGIDGTPGVGKSTLAANLGRALKCPVIGCDSFIRDGSRHYPDLLNLVALTAELADKKVNNAVIIVEGVMLELVFDALALTEKLSIYVRRRDSNGKFSHHELFDSDRSETDLLCAANELCRAIGISDDAPLLDRELITYHKRRQPQLRADYLFDVEHHSACE